MSNIIYLSIKGKVQDLISKGCDSYASIGNKCQINHMDETFVLQFDHSLSREYSVAHHPVKFYRPVNKSSPLLDAVLSENRELSAVFNFYRVNSGGCIKRLYTIELRGAHSSNILTCYPYSITYADSQPEEVIALSYRNITWKRYIVSMESYSRWEERIF